MIKNLRGADPPGVPDPMTHLRITLAVACELTLLVGCGEIHLGDRKWNCDKTAVKYSTPATLGTGDRFWRFNDGSLAPEPSATESLAIPPSTPLPGLSNAFRIGGEGAALAIGARAGSSSGVIATEQALDVGSSFTYALWISLPQSWLDSVRAARGTTNSSGQSGTRMVLVSTKSVGRNPTSCDGFDLAIQGDQEKADSPVRIQLAFGYYDSYCTAQKYAVEIEPAPTGAPSGLASSDAWGLGKWYHVAATVSGTYPSASNSEIALYWDARLIGAPTRIVPKSTKSFSALFSVGSSASGTERFVGTIDDVALFQHALTQGEIETLRLNSNSNYGLDGLRWSTWNSARSSAGWRSNQTEGLAVECLDGDSGGCGLSAALNWGTPIADIDHIVLNADLPAGHITDFMLAADPVGRQFCKWSINGIGGADYRISVTEQATDRTLSDARDPRAINELKWCKCDDCACDFEVKTATIGSEWTKAANQYPCVACGLQFEPFAVDADRAKAFRWRRGAIGASSLCWRPIAYDPTSHVHFVEEPQPEQPVRAWLSGPEHTTALLAADLGRNGYRLTATDRIVICANLPRGNEFQLVLKSENEGYCEIMFEGQDADPSTTTAYPKYTNNSTTLEECLHTTDANNPLRDEDTKPIQFDPANIRYIGIQKSWTREVDVTVRVNSVHFDGVQDCASVKSAPQMGG